MIKPIPLDTGCYKYGVTKCGRVWNLTKNRELSPWYTQDGYLQVEIIHNTTHKVHRLVALCWVPNPNDKPHVNHLDKVRDHNHAENLEWCTAQENNEYSLAKPYVFRNPTGEAIEVFNLSKFCREVGLSQGNMHKVHSGERKQHKGWTQC